MHGEASVVQLPDPLSLPDDDAGRVIVYDDLIDVVVCSHRLQSTFKKEGCFSENIEVLFRSIMSIGLVRGTSARERLKNGERTNRFTAFRIHEERVTSCCLHNSAGQLVLRRAAEVQLTLIICGRRCSDVENVSS